MATDDDDEESPRLAAYPSALRTAVRNNSSAYSYSLSITVSFGLVNSARGSPHVAEAFLFLIGAAMAFIVVEAAASRGFRRPVRSEGERVVVAGSAIDLVAMACAVGVAAAVAHLPLPGWAAWTFGGHLATGTFLLVGGLDVLIARRLENRP